MLTLQYLCVEIKPSSTAPAPAMRSVRFRAMYAYIAQELFPGIPEDIEFLTSLTTFVVGTKYNVTITLA